MFSRSLPTKAKKIQTEVAMRTDVGLVRQKNEDAMAFDADAGLYIVCDGMGGAAAGDIASKLAVDTFLASARQGRLIPTEIEHAMEEAALRSNTAVFDYALENPRLRGMGTTLVAIHIPKDDPARDGQVPVVIAHVGDSRCYRVRNGQMEAITEDHSLVAEQVRLGEITEEEAANSPMRNVITRAIGSMPDVEVDVYLQAAQNDDVFLLCSDGLNRDMNDAQIQTIMTMRGLKLDMIAKRLVDAANEAGGGDNTTVMLLRVRF